MEEFGFAIVMIGSKKPFVLYGAFSQGIMFIERSDPLPATGKVDQIEVLRDMNVDKKARRGMKVIVSEAAPDISKALSLHHKTVHERNSNGVPIVNLTIPIFEEILNSGSLVVSPDSGLTSHQFTLPSSSYEIEFSLTGESFYRIQWQGISEEVKAALLAVYATTYHAVDSASYLKEVGMILAAPKPVNSDYAAMMETVSQFDSERTEKEREDGAGTLTGQQYGNNPNDRVL